MEPKRCPKCGLPSYGDSHCSNCMAPLTGLEEPFVDKRAASPITPGSRFVSTMAGILVLGLGVYWLWIFGQELANALDSRPEVIGGARVYAVAILSAIMGLYTLFVSLLLFRRSYRARGELILVSVAGIILGVLVPVLLGSWYQIAVVGAHAVMVLFALFGARFFDFGE